MVWEVLGKERAKAITNYTTAAACGLSAELIKTLGRWKSCAYQLYVRLPKSQLAGISKTLAAATSVATPGQ